jgi:hypothetical protein
MFLLRADARDETILLSRPQLRNIQAAARELGETGAAANIPIVCADGIIRRWPGRFTLIRDARGTPAGAAAVLVTPADGDPALFDL